MRFMLFICEDPTAEPYIAEEDNIQEWVGSLGSHAVDGDRLRPAREAVTVRRRDGVVSVTDGPFTESKELIAGFDIIDVPDQATAIEIAGRHPMARFGRVEVREFWPFES
jgi:hypothetical protein